jgi:hypothetical protein
MSRCRACRHESGEGLAASLVEPQRRPEADIECQGALTFYREVGATRYIRQGEALLAASA